jgi:hypothetical protein
LASKAVYTLSENLFGGQIPDPNAVRSLELLEERYVINKQNFYDFSPADHPRDSILLEPKDAGARGEHLGGTGKGFWVFAVKGTATAQDWIDDFDAGRNVSANASGHHTKSAKEEVDRGREEYWSE